MKLTSMKNTPKKTLRSTMNSAVEAPMEDEQPYPWGLEVSLNEDSIKKLKLDVANMSAGDDVYFAAKAKITRISLNDSIHHRTGKPEKNGDIGLQIQQMGWGKPGKD